MPRDLIGQTLLDQFRVDRFLASGGMAAIYLVWDLQRSVPLAMKVLQPDLAADPAFIARFQREASSLQQLIHPNIVPFYGLYQAEDEFFLLQRYIDGPSLDEILRRRRGVPLPLAEALIYFKALYTSVGYAHAQGIIHCDIKPGNVLVDRGGSVYLTDFGIARYINSAATTSGSMGTPLYMAPEQVQGLAVSPPTDVYALGVVLFELLTGRRPFRGDVQDQGAQNLSQADRIRYQHVYEAPPDPCSINSNIPRGIARVLLKALEKNPANRYPSAQAMADDIAQVIAARFDTLPDRVRLPEEENTVPEFSPFPVGQVVTPPPTPPSGFNTVHPAAVPREEPVSRWEFLRKRRSVLVLLAVLAFLSICALAVGGLFRAVSLGRLPGAAGRSTATATFLPVSLPTTADLATQAQSPTPGPLPTIPAPTSTSPPSGGRPTGEIVIVQRSQGQDRLFIFDISSGEQKELPGVPNVQANLSQAPQWSQDGALLAWMTRYGGKMHIAVMDLDEWEPYQIPAGEAYSNVSSPSWQAGGNTVTFWAAGSRGGWLVTADGVSGEMIGRINLAEYRNLFTWNPQNNLAAFARKNGDRYEVVISASAEAEGTAVGSGGEEYAPAWSADGAWLAYQSDARRERGENEIWIVRADGRGSRQVTSSPAGTWSRAPTWSADGRWIAFVSNRSGGKSSDHGELFVVEVATGAVEQLTNSGGWVYDWRPAWRPR